MALVKRSSKHSKLWAMRSWLKLLGTCSPTHAVTFVGTKRWDALHLAMKSITSHSSATLFRVALGRQPFFGCCRTIWGIHTPSLDNWWWNLSRDLRTKWRLLPRVIAQKTTIMMHPFVAGELFITSPHWDIRWANVDWGFRVVEHFNFGHPEVWREDHWFNLGRIWFGDSMGHLNQLFLIIILVGSP